MAKVKKNAKAEKKLRVEPALPGGFRDYAGSAAIAHSRMLETIRRAFERFGFDPMETPAIERTQVLVGEGAASDKIIFRVVSAARGEIKDIKKGELSLRFDLTVPLARFIAAHAEIPKPFKRYQIGEVFRGERPQAGRFRSFLQADIDIVGVKSLDADAEIIYVVYHTLKALGAKNILVKINFKDEAQKLLEAAGVRKTRQAATLIAVDKKEKLGSRAWESEIKKASGLNDAGVKKYVSSLLAAAPPREAYAALQDRLRCAGVPEHAFSYDATIVRGLGYYTGAMFEAMLQDLPEIGAVASGGRYDGLTKRFFGQEISAVGGSIGVDRLFLALQKLGITAARETLTDVLILNLLPDATEYTKLRLQLMNAKLNTSVYLGDDRSFQAQIAYAAKKEIPFVVILGENEKKKGVVAVKNMQSREQKEMPARDVIPYILSFKK